MCYIDIKDLKSSSIIIPNIILIGRFVFVVCKKKNTFLKDTYFEIGIFFVKYRIKYYQFVSFVNVL